MLTPNTPVFDLDSFVKDKSYYFEDRVKEILKLDFSAKSSADIEVSTELKEALLKDMVEFYIGIDTMGNNLHVFLDLKLFDWFINCEAESDYFGTFDINIKLTNEQIFKLNSLSLQEVIDKTCEVTNDFIFRFKHDFFAYSCKHSSFKIRYKGFLPIMEAYSYHLTHALFK